MVEIQCFDGDGAVPPELQALVKENQRLTDLLEERNMEIRGLRMDMNKKEQELRDFGNKLWQIQNIVNAKDMVDEEYPVKSKFNCDGEYEQEPEVVDEDVRRAARVHFDAMMGRNA
jgi:hypothetical protein